MSGRNGDDSTHSRSTRDGTEPQDRFAVVGCSNCSALWIIPLEGPYASKTASCPRCGETKPTGHAPGNDSLSFRHLETASTREQAAEYRSRILASKAGEIESYSDEPHYAEQRERLDFDSARERFAEDVDASLDEHRELFQPLGDEHQTEREAYLAQEVEERFAAWSERLEPQGPDAKDALAGLVDWDADRLYGADYDLGDGRPEPELSISQQHSIRMDASATLTDQAPTSFVDEVASTAPVRSALSNALDELADGRTREEFEAIVFHEVLDGDDRLVHLVSAAARATFDGHASRREDILDGLAGAATAFGLDAAHATPRLLELAGVRPEVVIHVEERVVEQRRDQADPKLAFIAALAHGARVRLVMDAIAEHRFRNQFFKDLPGISQTTEDPHHEQRPERRRDRARAEFQIDAVPTKIVALLEQQDSEMLRQSELHEYLSVGASRISQVLNGSLEPPAIDESGLGLVRTHDLSGGKRVELAPAGRLYLDDIRSAEDEKSVLDFGFSDASQNLTDSRDHASAREGDRGDGDGNTADGDRDDDRHRLPQFHETRVLPRWQGAGIAFSAPDGGVSAVSHPYAKSNDRGGPAVRYLRAQDRLAVSAEIGNPMQMAVVLARSLIAPLGNDEHGIETERLNDTDGLLSDGLSFLRDARCLQDLPQHVDGAEDYVRRLEAAEMEICEMTSTQADMEWGSEDRVELRSEVLAASHGLIGTMLHIYDHIGVDVSIELRFPFDLDEEGHRKPMLQRRDHEHIARFLATMIAIGSKYGAHTAYRQLYEYRVEKQEQSWTPTIDASDPVGEFTAGIALTGWWGTQRAAFLDELKSQVEHPRELRDDAAEFVVGVPFVEDLGRQPFAEAVAYISARKKLRCNRAAVNAVRAFVDTPYDAAYALDWLSIEDTPGRNRRLRVEEVRYALQTLPSDRLLADHPPSISKVLSVLLSATEGLSQAEVAARAELADGTVSEAIRDLEALGYAVEVGAGWRLDLAFRTSEERGSMRLPSWADPESDDSRWIIDIVEDLVDELEPDPQRWTTPGDPLAEAFGLGDAPPDLLRLSGEWVWMSSYLRRLRDIGVGPGDEPGVPARSERVEVVYFGNRPKQTSIRGAASRRLDEWNTTDQLSEL